MPAPFYRVCAPVPKGTGKEVRWVRIGTATYDQKKDRIRITLDALPFRAENLMCFPADPDEARGEGKSRGAAFPPPSTRQADQNDPPPPSDDDIPF